jgi:hypothetical protein
LTITRLTCNMVPVLQHFSQFGPSVRSTRETDV